MGSPAASCVPRTSGALALLATIVLCAGCSEPGEHFDDFLARADRTPP